MSANIPFEIQEEIIKKVVPIKSLLRFRSVSKQWKSLIDSSEFITHHTFNHTQPDHLLLSYREDGKDNYISIVDDDSFPRHHISPTIPLHVKLISKATMIGCSHGLVCLSSYAPEPINGMELIVLWNPSIRKSVCIMVSSGFTALGFGVCPKSGDLKIVKITENVEAKVFTLSTRTWKTISMNLRGPLKSDRFDRKQVVIDGVIYWTDCDVVVDDDEEGEDIYHNWIISFDLASEEFEEVYLPDSFSYGHVSIFKLKESLALINHDEDLLLCDVWMMKKSDDSEFSFAKLYSINLHASDGLGFYQITGFRKMGELITQHVPIHGHVRTLKVYEPYTQRFSDLGFEAPFFSGFRMTSYTESLLLLNHSGSAIMY